MVTGSGGSNRIRTAVLQVLLNLIEHAMGVEEAVCSPRIHYESGVLSVEHGFIEANIGEVLDQHPDHQLFTKQSMFFGGAHTVRVCGGDFSGSGDPRRGGACLIV